MVRYAKAGPPPDADARADPKPTADRPLTFAY